MNETKTKILHCLSDGKWRTSSGIARNCGLKLTNASELLRRYRGQGLVNRERNYQVPRGYLYRITAIGIKRLHYLKSSLALATSYLVDDIGQSGTEQPILKSGLTLTGSSMADDIGLSGKQKEVFEDWVVKQLGGV